MGHRDDVKVKAGADDERGTRADGQSRGRRVEHGACPDEHVVAQFAHGRLDRSKGTGDGHRDLRVDHAPGAQRVR